MTILTSEESDSLMITDFIFHVVHNDSGIVYFDEVPWSPYKEFFLNRVRETIGGNSYQFLAKTGRVRSILSEIQDKPNQFVAQSKNLAEHFQQFNKGNIPPGVMILIQLQSGRKTLFSIIKYEHETVLAYAKSSNSNKAILSEIHQSFTESPKAMQKSSLIQITSKGGSLAVKDRSNLKGISQYFQGFLEVKRARNEKEMTESLLEIATNTVKKHRADLPKEVTSRIRNNCHEYARNSDVFDEKSFFDQVFGPSANESVRRTYNRQLRDNFEVGETFELDKSAIPAPKGRNLRTLEGVTIRYTDKASGTVELKDLPNSQKQIIVTTAQLYDE